MGGIAHWDPKGYLDYVRTEIPQYEQLQEQVVKAARLGGVKRRRVLDLGSGTGETARRIIDAHPNAELLGIDASGEMLVAARAALKKRTRVHFRIGRLEDDLPSGPFDLVTSALTVHHLAGPEKRDLFSRVAAVLRPSGRFVLGDVVVPDDPDDVQVELSQHDQPSPIGDQIDWLRDAGLEPHLCWAEKDLAVIAADAATTGAGDRG